jgi:serine/threonine protein kinase
MRPSGRVPSNSGGGGFSAALAGGNSNAETKLRALYDVTEKVVGKGAYGSVVRGVSRATAQPVAIKRIDKAKVGTKGISSLLGEVETLGMLSHPFIVRLIDVFHDPASMIIVMEFVPGGELGKVLRAHGTCFPETTVQRIALELLLAIEHFHGRGIVHRDLKLANCLVSDVQYRPARIVTSTSLAHGGGINSPLHRFSAPIQGRIPSARRASNGNRSASSDPPSGGTSARSVHAPSALEISPGISASAPALKSWAAPAGVAADGWEGEFTAGTSLGGQSITSPNASISAIPPQSLSPLPPATIAAPDPVVSVKIADFGFGVMVGDDPCLTSYCGTVQYMAPEILRRSQTGGPVSYGKPVDLWALGVMVFYMLTGEHPFNGATSTVLHDHICSGDYTNARRMSTTTSERWAQVSSFGKSFVAGLLSVDPSRRMTASEGLRHPWVKGALELNNEDRARREWIQEQLDDGLHTGVLDDDTLNAITGGNATLVAAGASFVSPESAVAASEAARHVAQRSIAGSPSYAAQRRTAVIRKLRAAGIAVRAANRLVFGQQLRRLDAKPDLQGIAVLRSFRYLVSGRYEPPVPPAGGGLSSSGGHGSGAGNDVSIHTGRLTIAAQPAVSFRGNMRALNVLLGMADASVTVEVLDLSDAGIDHADTVQRIARLATNHPSITTLDLSRNPIPPLAGRALVRLARSAIKLRSLHLSDTTLAPDTVHAIHQRLATTVTERAALGPSSSAIVSAIPRTVGGGAPGLHTAASFSVGDSRMASPKNGPPSRGTSNGRDYGVASPPRTVNRTSSTAGRRAGYGSGTPVQTSLGGSSSPPRRISAATPTPSLPPLHSSPPRIVRRGV